MRGEYSPSIQEAVKKYPSLKPTVNLAKEFKVKLKKHYAKFTKRGQVYQHMWLTSTDFDPQESWQSNNELLCWLRNCRALKKDSLKNI